MNIQGTVSIVKCDVGSKSEGTVAFLRVDEKTTYKLYREDVYAVNDRYFDEFDKMEVIVEGEVEGEGYLCVTGIEPAIPQQESIKEKPDIIEEDEEDMHQMQ